MNNLKNKTISIIGAGNIGQILTRRLLKNDFPKDQLSICECDPEKQNIITTQFGVIASPITEQAIWGSDLILVTTPPNVAPEIFQNLSQNLRAGQILISFAAAVSIQRLEMLVPEGVAIARVMPNAPSLVGQGCNPAAYSSKLTEEAKSLIKELLTILGETLAIKDEQMNWGVGLSGAAMRSLLPALEGMTNAGIEAGLRPTDARKIAAQVMLGTATLVQQTDLSFDQIKALTPMQTVDEAEVISIFEDAARQAQEKIEKYQKKLESSDKNGQ